MQDFGIFRKGSQSFRTCLQTTDCRVCQQDALLSGVEIRKACAQETGRTLPAQRRQRPVKRVHGVKTRTVESRKLLIRCLEDPIAYGM